MSAPTSYWVLGHRITPVETQADYALLHAVTPAGMDGPPPHYHEGAAELFLVVRGELQVMIGESWQTLGPGQSACVPKGAVHTFRNATDGPTEWVTSFGPRGFEPFFTDFGVPAEQPGAQEASLAPEVIGRVIRDCRRYGMIIPQHVLDALTAPPAPADA